MIITLIGIILTIFGFFMIEKDTNSTTDMLSGISALIGMVCLAICLIIILGTHICVQRTININQMEYESLCKRLEIINSDYEDVSKSEVVKDIAEWNKEVYNYKYWTFNPWTNWMYSKRVANELKYIEFNAGDI